MTENLLRSAKDSALMAIRLFSNFLGLGLRNPSRRLTDQFRPKGDDVSVQMVGGEYAALKILRKDEQSLLQGLLRRADKELAHLTANYLHHDDFNTAEAILRGVPTFPKMARRNVELS